MAKIFVSSTCYDLKEIRNQLKDFLVSIGHIPMLSEKNDVFFNPILHTHNSCIEAVSKSDIIVLIIGSRYGGAAIHNAYDILDGDSIHRLLDKSFVESFEQAFRGKNFSITQLEILYAIQKRKPIYTFILQDVLHDHNVYEKNKTKNPGIIYPSIEKPETANYIFEFINFMRKRTSNNAIYAFSSGSDIEQILLKQFSLLFDKGLELLNQPIDNNINDDKKIIQVYEKYEKSEEQMLRDALKSKKINALTVHASFFTEYFSQLHHIWEKKDFDEIKILLHNPNSFTMKKREEEGVASFQMSEKARIAIKTFKKLHESNKKIEVRCYDVMLRTLIYVFDDAAYIYLRLKDRIAHETQACRIPKSSDLYECFSQQFEDFWIHHSKPIK